MVFIAKLIVLALTAAATPILRRDAITVENDITQKIGPQITTLYNDVQGFPASGSSGALVIHTDIQNLVAAVNSATSDIKDAGSFSEEDGTNILMSVQNVLPDFLGALSAIRDQEPSWRDVPGGKAQVLADLQGLNATFDRFADALSAAAPADLVPAFVSIKDEIVEAFTSAIAAYSG